MENYRIFVEKHPRFRVEADSLRRELNTNLNLDIRSLRLLNVYDLFGFSRELLEKSRYSVFGEVVTDSVTDSCDLAGRKYIAVEYLPGQFDQRAASAVDCVRLIDPSAQVRIRSSKLLLFDGAVTDEEIALAVANGVIKMNIDTDTQWAFWDGVRAFYKKNEGYLQGQIGNPEGDDKPNKKYYDPRAWLRKGEESFKARLKQAFEDLNNVGTLA